MGVTMLPYGSDHAPLWECLCSPMGVTILPYGSAYAPLWE